jgi:hypothetical protein
MEFDAFFYREDLYMLQDSVTESQFFVMPEFFSKHKYHVAFQSFF